MIEPIPIPTPATANAKAKADRPALGSFEELNVFLSSKRPASISAVSPPR